MQTPVWPVRCLAVLEDELRALGASYSIHSMTSTSLNIILINRGQFLRVTPRAASQVPPELRTRSYYAAQLAEARVRQELDVLKEAQHPGILSCLDCPPSLLALEAVVCVTDLCFQDLGACCAMRYAYEGVPPYVVLKALTVLMSAIQYIHGKGICHRRVCPSRILIDTRCTNDTKEWWCHLKLSGFKDGRRFHAEDMVGLVGERRYAAPEMLARSSYCEKVDVWSGVASLAGFLFPASERQIPDRAFRLSMFLLGKEGPSKIKETLKNARGLVLVLQEALCECPRRRRSAAAICCKLQSLNESNKRRRCGSCIQKWQEDLARSLVSLKNCSAGDLASETRVFPEKRKELVSTWFARLSDTCDRLRLDVTGPIAAATLAMAEFTETRERRRISPSLEERQAFPEFPEHELES